MIHMIQELFGQTLRPMDDGVTYRTGRMPDGATIVAATANSMGMIETAIITSKFIKAWSPRLIGMIGICGGRKEKGLSIGDIVVPTQTFHYQFGSYKEGRLHKELRVENSDKQLLAPSLRHRGSPIVDDHPLDRLNPFQLLWRKLLP